MQIGRKMPPACNDVTPRMQIRPPAPSGNLGLANELRSHLAARPEGMINVIESPTSGLADSACNLRLAGRALVKPAWQSVGAGRV